MLFELHHSLHMPGVRVSHLMTFLLRTGPVVCLKQPRWLVGEAGAADCTGDGAADGDAAAAELLAELGAAEDGAADDGAADEAAALDAAAFELTAADEAAVDEA